MKHRIAFLVALGILFATSAWTEPHPRSATFDPTLYAQLPRKATLVSRSYDQLPPAVSLKAMAPYPADQGQYGTCTAWASAYAARTLAESEALHRTDRKLTTNNVFSPVFVYKSISSDPTCSTGTNIADALTVMKTTGIPKRISQEFQKDFKDVSLTAFAQAPKYTIADFVTLESEDENGNPIPEQKITAIKKSLSEGKPVVFGMICPDSFNDAKGVWNPTEQPDPAVGSHAMCIVGYDDRQYGGAFEVQNSWGTDWGNDGYIWIRYSDFTRFDDDAYELIGNLQSDTGKAAFEGAVRYQIQGRNEGLTVKANKDGVYVATKGMTSGTQFRLFLHNSQPAYVYAFASDEATKKTTAIFPYDKTNTSAALDYSDNEVAFPDEKHWIRLDQVTGTDYLVVLYSKKALDLQAIRAAYERASGGLATRVAAAVGPHWIPVTQAHLDQDRPGFKVNTQDQEGVFGLMLAIPHTAN